MFRPNRRMQEIIEAYAALNPLPIETLTPALARQMPAMDRAVAAVYGKHAVMRTLTPMLAGVGRVQHRVLRTAGGDLMLRLYTPDADVPHGGWPVLLYFHGGGFVVGHLNHCDAACRTLCEQAECLVVSVHYRQAPEHPWPAAVDDAFAAYQWATSQTLALGGNQSVVAVAGEGAGGNLAAVVCHLARDKRIQRPVHQLLIYPITDLAGGVHNLSALHHADARPLSRALMQWYYDQYAPAGVDRTHGYLSPLHALNFTGLPPATILNAEVDPIRDDGEAYADRLDHAGVNVNWKLYPGVTHDFFNMMSVLDEASQAVALAAEELRDSFDYAETLEPAGSR